MKTLFINKKYLLVFAMAALVWAGCKKEEGGSKSPSIKSGPDSVSIGGVVILEGSDLANIKSVVFEAGNASATFNPVLNNPNAIIFRVPNTAEGGATKIILTNGAGAQITYPVVVVTPAVIETISSTDYVADMEITITGKNLQEVSEVNLVDLNDEPLGKSAIVVSKSKTELVIKMPASADNMVKLEITNSSSTVISGMYFVNIDNASKMFTDNYAPNVENWSWGGGDFPSDPAEKVMGTASLRVDQRGVSAGSALRLVNNGLIPFGNHTYVSFWIKGADVATDYNFCLGDPSLANVEWQTFNAPANKWTYVTFPLQIWKAAGMTSARSVVIQLRAEGKLVYLDNIVFN